jgi:glycosyltransferase involved in cell wall biosynthesis
VKPPLVSVVIPTHNYARFIPEAIESALAQDYAPLEIIVVDNGSTDETRAAIEPFRERGISYVYQEDAGPSGGRNTGIELARGELVAFLDADDAWLPGKTSAQVAHLIAHPELGLVGSGAFECDATNQPTGIRKAPPIEAEMAFEQLLVRNFLVTTGVIVRKRCHEVVGGFKDMSFGEDWDLWLRIARRYPIGFVQEPLFKRRGHPSALSFEIGDQLLTRYREIGEGHLPHAQPAWLRPIIRRRLHSTACFYAAGYAIDRDRKRAARLLLTSLWLDPVTLVQAKIVLLLRAVLPDRAFARLRALYRRRAGALPERL